ncbi:hypothetical protein HMPREF1594_01792 [Escherichia coli 907446]|nr:hypothetical protein HMPREF1594_01792 [Escherichia coli 907446]
MQVLLRIKFIGGVIIQQLTVKAKIISCEIKSSFLNKCVPE